MHHRARDDNRWRPVDGPPSTPTTVSGSDATAAGATSTPSTHYKDGLYVSTVTDAQ